MACRIVNEVSELGVSVAYSVVEGVNNRSYGEELPREIGKAVEEARKSLTLEGLRDHPVIRAYRDFYWRVVKVDPTKQRPAQEALLRRILRGEPLPRINPVVDAGNAASIKFMVPIGLYDVGKVKGCALRLRRSRPGEVFLPIGGKATRLEGQIVLAADGQILHVYPHRDSQETSVDEETRDVLLVVAGVPGVEARRLVEAARYLRGLLSLLGGRPGPIETA